MIEKNIFLVKKKIPLPFNFWHCFMKSSLKMTLKFLENNTNKNLKNHTPTCILSGFLLPV